MALAISSGTLGDDHHQPGYRRWIPPERRTMDTAKTDQETFDEEVNQRGKLVLQILGGVGIVAALAMSIAALIISNDSSDSSMGGMPAAATATQSSPNVASVSIDHIARGCHTLTVNGGADSAPSARLHLTTGGTLHVQNNDVMPHQLLSTGGPHASMVAATMGHMGARSTVTFPTPGTYTLATKAGEDYTSGIQTIGADNTLKITVVVTAT
jgi:plastocyanin